jgi:hypothetical protein
MSTEENKATYRRFMEEIVNDTNLVRGIVLLWPGTAAPCAW